MHRFFVAPDQIGESVLTISGEDYHHLTRVLRIGKDEVFEVCDGRGKDYHCVIDHDDNKQVICRIVDRLDSKGESDIAFTLYQGLPKGTKMDEVIQKTTELGICRIVPFISERTVTDLKDKAAKKQDRWQKIAYAAAKQSKRGIIPRIEIPIPFRQMIDHFTQYDLVILCYEEEKQMTLKQALESGECRPRHVAFIVGPEGGLAPSEADLMVQAGAVSVSLGSRILRTETVGMAVLSQLSFFYGA